MCCLIAESAAVFLISVDQAETNMQWFQRQSVLYAKPQAFCIILIYSDYALFLQFSAGKHYNTIGCVFLQQMTQTYLIDKMVRNKVSWKLETILTYPAANLGTMQNNRTKELHENLRKQSHKAHLPNNISYFRNVSLFFLRVLRLTKLKLASCKVTAENHGWHWFNYK